jgi:hypothetical protein
MFRREGDVLRLGTAIGKSRGREKEAGGAEGRRRERGLMHETPSPIKHD